TPLPYTTLFRSLLEERRLARKAAGLLAPRLGELAGGHHLDERPREVLLLGRLEHAEVRATEERVGQTLGLAGDREGADLALHVRHVGDDLARRPAPGDHHADLALLERGEAVRLLPRRGRSRRDAVLGREAGIELEALDRL